MTTSSYRILTINPGSTSTKIALFEGEKLIFERNISHEGDELRRWGSIPDQFPYRKKLILAALEKEGIALDTIRIIVGRGGLVKPVESGVYRVNDRLKEDLRTGVMGQHASNLGGLIAADLAAAIPGAAAYIADPVVVDEMEETARVAGHPLFPRKSIFHALNQKAVARIYARSIGKKYEDLNLIVAHMGGGISVGAHCKGRVIDVNNTLDGTGAFSPERSGTLESGALVNICFSGKYTRDEVYAMLVGKGGVTAWFGHGNTKKLVEDTLAGDAKAALIIDALAYNVSKEIGSMATVLSGKVDAVLLTGGIAYSSYICEKIEKRVAFIAGVTIYPGEDEMKALAMNGLAVLDGSLQPKEYR